MAQNWRNYAACYVIPYIGQRDVQDINGEVCDALYQKLLAEGRLKAKPKEKPAAEAAHVRRVSADGKGMPCRPYGYDSARCYRKHARTTRSSERRSRRRSSAGRRPGPKAPARRFLPAWIPRQWSTRTGCFIARGKISRPGAGPAQRRRRRAPAARPSQGPQGLDGQPAIDVPPALAP